jgi:F420-dependent oxidoreductase-like protein
MRIGLHIGKFHWPGSPENISDKLTEIAQVADDVGFYSLWVMDHIFQLGTQYGTIHAPVEEAMLEAYTTIAYLAAVTKKIKVGAQVTCNFLRNPALVVKMLTTIDVLSEGRTYLGIGAGWFEREAVGYGYNFPSLKVRFEQLEETLQIIKHMWSGNIKPFEGKCITLKEPLNNPPSVTKPHPPILVGGSGEKKTLRLVTKYGDACNIVLGTTLKYAGALTRDGITWDHFMEYLSHKFVVLKQHCGDVGRPYDEIEKTATTYIQISPDAMNGDEIFDICKKLNNVGCEHVVFNMPNVHESKPLEIIGQDVIPRALEL